MFKDILENVKSKTPLVHSITNYVTVNDCANIILASNGSPIMADDINEVEDITSICSSLVINIGTLNERTIKSMIKAGKKSNKLNHPVILDPVGAGASTLRSETIITLLKEVNFSVIRGNISEIKFIANGTSSAKGVDANIADTITNENIDDAVKFARDLSNKLGSVIVITGAIDIVSDNKKTYIIKNGNPLMSKVTGTGCMLTSVIGTFIGGNHNNILDATACAVSSMGLCGELAYNKIKDDIGINTYRMLIIDFMGKINNEVLKDGAKIEIR
ncbi:MAG: hydroxyethylthiazole kinase [Clostridium sp.]